MDLSPAALALIAVASVAAGLVNAVAGGGTLIAFPALTVFGIPTVEANIATTVALTPGYLGGTLAQRSDLAGQRPRLLRLLPVAAAGAVAGALLLLATSESLFRAVVPWLLFGACGLLAAQDRIRTAVDRRHERRAEAGRARHATGLGPVVLAITFASAVYGGYFGAGLGVVLLAVLGVALDDDLRRINALKQLLSLVINTVASVLLLFSGRLPWAATAVMAVGSLVGGTLGGHVAGRLDPVLFRRLVIAVGLVVGVIYLVRS
jgi:uncharacterized membrane protein YfcA